MLTDEQVKILFVDDDQSVLDAVRRQFRKQYMLETALGGEEALELIGSSEPFAIIVSDLRMQGMDGLELLRQVRALSPDTITIMLTGFADTEVAVAAVNEGCVFRFLTKPCPGELLSETLHEAELQYKKVLAMSSFTYTGFIEDGKISSIKRGRGCLAVTGYSAQDFLKNPELWNKTVAHEYREASAKQLADIIENRESPPLEFQLIKRDDSVCWVRNTIIPQYDDRGSITRFDGLVEDITETKKVEEELRLSESKYHRMVANVPGLVFQFILKKDGQMRFAFLSDRCKELVGLEPGEVMEDYSIFFEKFKPYDRAEIYHLMAQSAEDLTPWEWWASGTFKGAQKLLQSVGRPERLEDGSVLWDGIMLDMTEHRKKEEQIRQLAKFPSENPNPVLRVSETGQIIYANKSADPLLNLWSRQVGQNLPESLQETVQFVRSRNLFHCIEVTCKEHVFSIVFAGIEGEDYVNLYAREITEIKQAEMELRRANEVLKEHDRLKSEFVSTVSHELRTPLCIFKNIISNAMAGVMGKLSHKLYENLKLADQSVDRLARIVGDFLDISKIEAGSMTLNMVPFAIQRIAEDAVYSLNNLASVKNIDIKTNMPKGDLVVKIDKDRMVQVFTNLIGNAIKFIPEKSTINIEITEEDSQIEVAVKDNGPGLKHDQLDQIFDRFIQVHHIAGEGEHGTGLGLTITKELVEMHNGKIWVESTPGEGCTFRFTLPKFDPEAEKQAAHEKLLASVRNPINE